MWDVTDALPATMLFNEVCFWIPGVAAIFKAAAQMWKDRFVPPIINFNFIEVNSNKEFYTFKTPPRKCRLFGITGTAQHGMHRWSSVKWCFSSSRQALLLDACAAQLALCLTFPGLFVGLFPQVLLQLWKAEFCTPIMTLVSLGWGPMKISTHSKPLLVNVDFLGQQARRSMVLSFCLTASHSSLSAKSYAYPFIR